MTTEELVQYYANLLIVQYLGKDKAYATVSTSVRPIIMDQLPLQVQNAFCIGEMIIGGVTYPGAVGAQLDILAKYLGVTRNGYDLTGNPVTLNDIEFTTLLKLAIVKNSSGSSLYDIQALIHLYFANEIFVYDGANMQMSYLITSSVGNQSLVELFITEGLLPKPMGVQLASLVYITDISLFGFRNYDNIIPAWSASTTYAIGAQVFEDGIVYSSLTNNNLNNVVTDATNWIAIIYPFNTYDTFPTYEPFTWLSYSDSVTII